ncbi:nuclear transport factor 2 family protein [Streptomyces sp. ME19-01-6]|uniref:nuclear transport factor 2 family protein n=1 Tax=Streptomyces sp. ME19-01-6 TaxID=3028686 RepID=UPI0029B216FC|nr:nuclear transport factor 2 family protein [Streptomyces sp. ME19-01-6]MDX3233530.1 nuclear transport factor 2 family protein [Streptomyces sp. ME19-01-6]
MSQQTDSTAVGVPQVDWTKAFDAQSQAAFGQAFAPDVALEAALLTRPIEGRERVARVMALMSNTYESLEFTHQATNDRRTYLEWTAVALGGLRMKGVTVLVRDEQGRIATVAIHHRFLNEILILSEHAGKQLLDVLNPDDFYNPAVRTR